MKSKLTPDEIEKKSDEVREKTGKAMNALRGGPPGFELTTEHPANSEWSVGFRFAYQHFQPVISEVRIFPTDPNNVPSGGLTTRLIRATTIEKAEQYLGKKAGELQREREQGAQQAVSSVTPEPQKRVVRDQQRGRPDSFYLALAREYVQLRNGGERHPIAAISRARRIKRSKVRDMVHEARKRGFLSLDIAGKSGGQLTQLAIELSKGKE